MGLDLQKWNPFRFSRGRAEARANAGGAAQQERPDAEGLEPARRLQALDPFGLLSGALGSPLADAGNGGRWFGDFTPALFQPRIDVVDDGDALRITAELPGTEKDDLEVIVEDGFLVLRGEKRVDSKQEEKGCYRLERAFGGFQRVLPLPDGVDVDRADARFERGLLSVRLPKKAGDAKAPRKVEIH
jgi:HSP20 family protein